MIRSSIKVAGAAVRGRSHEISGNPCQDIYHIWREKNKKFAGIALADGAGSSDYSQIGAEYAVNAVIPFVNDQFDAFYENPSDAGIKVTEFLSDGLNKVSSEHGLTLIDMACTLLFVLMRRKKKTIQYIAGHVGDGAIFYENSKKVEVLSEPERGEYANTTVFLTSSNVKSKLRIYTGSLLRPVGFMIMSDGAADTLYIKKTKSPNQVYSQQIFAWCNKYTQKKISAVLLKN